jgi:hypothetical protein
MKLWNPQELIQKGRELNDFLVEDVLGFAAGLPLDRPMAAAYSILVIANNCHDLGKRDAFLRLIRDRVTDRAELAALNVQRWSPAQRCLMAFASADGAETEPDPEALLKIQERCHALMTPSWSTLMPDKIYALVRSREKGSLFFPLVLEALLPPFGKGVQEAFGAYAGVVIDGHPSRVHHRYLQAFQRAWARSFGGDSLDVNSGLHQFGWEAIRSAR